MVKLTPELLAQASAGLNPIKERQLDLRGEQTHRLPRIAHTTFLPGYNIPTIENLGITRVRARSYIFKLHSPPTHLPGPARCHRFHR